MPLKGESKEDVGAVLVPTSRHLLDEVERARIGRVEVRGSVRSSVREVCARDAIVSGMWCNQLVAEVMGGGG